MCDFKAAQIQILVVDGDKLVEDPLSEMKRVSTHTYTHTHTHTHTYSHTHTHTHTLTNKQTHTHTNKYTQYLSQKKHIYTFT